MSRREIIQHVVVLTIGLSAAGVLTWLAYFGPLSH